MQRFTFALMGAVMVANAALQLESTRISMTYTGFGAKVMNFVSTRTDIITYNVSHPNVLIYLDKYEH